MKRISQDYKIDEELEWLWQNSIIEQRVKLLDISDAIFNLDIGLKDVADYYRDLSKVGWEKLPLEVKDLIKIWFMDLVNMVKSKIKKITYYEVKDLIADELLDNFTANICLAVLNVIRKDR